MKDWRGTPIEVGSRVLTHSKQWNHSIAEVTTLHDTTITVRLIQHDYYEWQDRPKKTLVTIPQSVTVLTKDMFDE